MHSLASYAGGSPGMPMKCEPWQAGYVSAAQAARTRVAPPTGSHIQPRATPTRSPGSYTESDNAEGRHVMAKACVNRKCRDPLSTFSRRWLCPSCRFIARWMFALGAFAAGVVSALWHLSK